MATSLSLYLHSSYLWLLVLGQIHACKMGLSTERMSQSQGIHKFHFCPFGPDLLPKSIIYESACTGEDALVFCFLEEYTVVFYLNLK